MCALLLLTDVLNLRQHQTLILYFHVSDNMSFMFEPSDGQTEAELLFTENETNTEKLYGSESYTKYFKDAFHRYVVNGESIGREPGLSM